MSIDPQIQVITVEGKVKWYDASKGYGFVTPEGEHSDIGDVMVHATCLLASGCQQLVLDAKVVLHALRRPRGFNAFKIISVVNPVEEAPRSKARTRVDVVAIGDFVTAEVKWYNRVKGYGFLTMGVGTPDIFIHAATLQRYGIVCLVPGQIVAVKYGAGKEGLMAAEIKAS